MTALVLLQAGHYPSAGGAPGEAQWTHALAARIRDRLAAQGIEATIVGDWFGKAPPAEAGVYYDLFVSLHYDAAVYQSNTGAFADRATGDPMGDEADRFIACWEGVYLPATGLRNAVERRNGNTSDYYAFRATSANTPGVLIEHGCGAPVGTGGFPPGDDAALLHDRIDLIAALDARAILDYLEVDDVTPEDRAILDTMHALGANAGSINDWITRLNVFEQDTEPALRNEIEALRSRVDTPVRIEGVRLVIDLGNTTLTVPLAGAALEV